MGAGGSWSVRGDAYPRFGFGSTQFVSPRRYALPAWNCSNGAISVR